MGRCIFKSGVIQRELCHHTGDVTVPVVYQTGLTAELNAYQRPPALAGQPVHCCYHEIWSPRRGSAAEMSITQWPLILPTETVV